MIFFVYNGKRVFRFSQIFLLRGEDNMMQAEGIDVIHPSNTAPAAMIHTMYTHTHTHKHTHTHRLVSPVLSISTRISPDRSIV